MPTKENIEKRIKLLESVKSNILVLLERKQKDEFFKWLNQMLENIDSDINELKAHITKTEHV